MAVLFMAACVVTWTLPREAQAAKYQSRTLIIPFDGEAGMFVVFRDYATGDLIHSTTGAVTVTWANAEITATNHAYSNDWIVAVPGTDTRFMYFTYYYTDPTDGTTAPDSANPVLYDARLGITVLEPPLR